MLKYPPRSDLLASSRSAAAPRFPFHQAETFLPLFEFTADAFKNDYRIHLNPSLATIHTIKRQTGVSRLLGSLHNLSTFLNSVGSQELPWDAAYPDRVYEVEYQLLASLFDDEITAENLSQRQIGTVLFHSMLLFIYTNLRETPVGGAIRMRLLKRLKIVVENNDIDVAQMVQDFPSEMLWTCLLGAAGAPGPVQAPFHALLRRISYEHNVHTWHEAREYLKSVPVFAACFSEKCANIWNSVKRGKTG